MWGVSKPCVCLFPPIFQICSHIQGMYTLTTCIVILAYTNNHEEGGTGSFFVHSSTPLYSLKSPKNRVFGFSNRVSGLLERIFGVFWLKFHGFYRVFEENSDFWVIFTPKSWNFWLKIEFLKILKSSFCQKSSSLTFGQIEFLSNRTKKKPGKETSKN